MTNQQDALYRAICEYPDEDAPRLVFADCVEEAGDASRAALIRTQVALARVPEYDPLWSQCRRDAPNAILGWALSYPLPSLPSGFSWHGHRMRRGFSWRATITHATSFAKQAAALFAAAPIQALEFPHSSGVKKHLGQLAESPSLGLLRRLDFSLTRLEEMDVRILGESPFANLSELRFEEHAVSAEGLQALATSPLAAQLTELELERPALPPAQLVGALASAEAGILHKLELRNCGLLAVDVAELLAAPWLQSLNSLELSENPLKGPGVAAIGQRAAMADLEVLKLSRTFPGASGIQALSESPNLPRLRWLDLSANRLGPATIRGLARSPIMRTLRVLDLSNNPIGAAGAAFLAEADAPELRELVLNNCGIDANRERSGIGGNSLHNLTS
ncbi:MAG TPA: TIGR02996 domain-containing protein [Gemmataceae bacterium]